jgi:hypothetical protein
MEFRSYIRTCAIIWWKSWNDLVHHWFILYSNIFFEGKSIAIITSQRAELLGSVEFAGPTTDAEPTHAAWSGPFNEARCKFSGMTTFLVLVLNYFLSYEE